MTTFDARTGRELRQLKVSLNARELAAEPRGDFLYALDDKGVIMRWRLR